jgi:outer membrane protein assembly factor BamB
LSYYSIYGAKVPNLSKSEKIFKEPPGRPILQALERLGNCEGENMIMTDGIRRSGIAGLLLLSGLLGVAAEENWPRWRGARDEGSIEGGNYPVKWEADKVLWKAALPGKGCSTPVVWKHQIYLTAPVEGMDAVLAFDWNGKEAWRKTFGKQNSGKHRNGSGSNASPATDGKGVFVYFKSGTFAALELDGKLRWKTNLVEAFGPDTLYWDHGSSPVLTEKNVIMTRMCQGESWIAAFDKDTGRMKWKVPRNYQTAVEGEHGYGTPLLVKHQGRETLLVWGGEHVTLHDLADGRVLWTDGDFGSEAGSNWPTVASPVFADDTAIIAYGRADRNIPKLYGIRIGAGGGKGGERIWKREDVGTFVPTPAIYKNQVYILRDRGELDCIEPKTGKTVWKDALPRSSKNFYGSPLIAGGKLYAVREDGVMFVGKIGGGRFELLAENDMGEKVIASPVPSEGRLLIRGEKNLVCVGGESVVGSR